MEYTHYWKQHDSFTKEEWRQIVKGTKKIISLSEIPLEGNDEGTKPCIDTNKIILNGIGDNGHEPFQINRVKGPPNWCKTAHKPYNLIVTAVLGYLDTVYPDKITVTSDGIKTEWEAGINLAKQAWKDEIDFIDCPAEIIEYYRDFSKSFVDR